MSWTTILKGAAVTAAIALICFLGIRGRQATDARPLKELDVAALKDQNATLRLSLERQAVHVHDLETRLRRINTSRTETGHVNPDGSRDYTIFDSIAEIDDSIVQQNHDQAPELPALPPVPPPPAGPAPDLRTPGQSVFPVVFLGAWGPSIAAGGFGFTLTGPLPFTAYDLRVTPGFLMGRIGQGIGGAGTLALGWAHR
jgi:hypothetical protein